MKIQASPLRVSTEENTELFAQLEIWPEANELKKIKPLIEGDAKLIAAIKKLGIDIDKPEIVDDLDDAWHIQFIIIGTMTSDSYFEDFRAGTLNYNPRVNDMEFPFTGKDLIDVDLILDKG